MVQEIKVILAGYEGSKQILSASSYLIKKYLKGFDVYFLNYGKYDGKLHTGTYVSLDEGQKSGAGGWARYVREYLRTLDDKYIIFGLDDYLLSKLIDMKLYNSIDLVLVDCVKLCSESNLAKHYSCTTQYTIWKRELLIEILEKVCTPWQFEFYGSQILNGMFKTIIHIPCMTYPSSSCLSTKWKGVRLDGNEHDADKIKKLL